MDNINKMTLSEQEMRWSSHKLIRSLMINFKMFVIFNIRTLYLKPTWGTQDKLTISSSSFSRKWLIKNNTALMVK
jgi:hypothetical protein